MHSAHTNESGIRERRTSHENTMAHTVVVQLPADSPSKNSLSRALRLIYRAIDEGRKTLGGVRSSVDTPTNLEKAFADLGYDLTLARGQLRISLMGSRLVKIFIRAFTQPRSRSI
jgi:hypothetical protein